MKKKLNILLVLVLIAAIGIATVLVSWLFASYRQRMEFLKGSIENDLFDSAQDIFLNDLQQESGRATGNRFHTLEPGLIDSIKLKFPDLSSDKIESVVHEFRRQEQKRFQPLPPVSTNNKDGNVRTHDPRRLFPPPFIRGMSISDQQVGEIKANFDARLRERNLGIRYQFTIGNPDPSAVLRVQPGKFSQQDGMLLRPLMIDPSHNKFILVKVEHSWKFFVYAMSWQLIVSLLILTTLLGSFVYLFLTIFRQNKLDIIRKSLIHSMSHELRTPVTTAKVALEAIEDFVDPDDLELRRSYNAMAREDLQHLSDMLDKVLDIANLDNKNQTPLDLRPIDLHQLLAHTIEHFNLLHKYDDLSINLLTGSETALLLADAHHLKKFLKMEEQS